MNEYTTGSDTNMFESTLTRSKIRRIEPPIKFNKKGDIFGVML